MKTDAILVLDFGGQYSHLISRRVREHKVYSELVPYDITPSEIRSMEKSFNIKGLILSGGPSSVYDKNAPQLDKRILTLGLPLLGICYGHQLIAYLSKGKVKPAAKKEFGITSATIDKPVEILDGLSSQERVWMSHGDTVYELPSEYESLAHTESCPISAFRHKKKPIYGLQWHPEVIHTEKGA